MATNSRPQDEEKIEALGQDVSKQVSVSKTIPGPRIDASPTDSDTILDAQASPSPSSTSLTPSPDHSTQYESVFWPTSSPNSTDNTISREYNVYATPFIPSILQSINCEQASIIETPSKHRIDYHNYRSTFVGSSFVLNQSPRSPVVGSPQTIAPHDQLDAGSYLSYFTMLWNQELAAKQQENENFALYQVPLYRTQNQYDELWALSIPGLREDSPLVEMGDVLQLRQLWVDGAGNLIGMPKRAEKYTFGPDGYPQMEETCWTGFQYNASVYSINRAQEAVYLRVDGLNELYVDSMIIPMIVNVVFPLKKNRLEGQWKALRRVSAELLLTVPSQSDAALQERFSEERSGTDGHGLFPFSKTQSNQWIQKILFPCEADGKLQTRLRKIPHRGLFDSAMNFEQVHAINDVCVNRYGVLPYLISGPPGTGKTKTLVEIAMQLLQTTDVAHILICAPSEAAADTLALRLKQYLGHKHLFRFTSPSRSPVEVPRELSPYCYMENDMYALPPFRDFMSFNVIVTSCSDAAILLGAKLTNSDLWHIERNVVTTFHPETEDIPTPNMHWGALLVDEAAQATEMDVLPAISVVCPPAEYPATLPQPCFVMAGDENQLGPRTASRDRKFATSLFARLFDRPLYKRHPLARSNMKPSSAPPVLKKSMLPIIYPPFTNLVRNYRSHPAILSIPSSLFYNDTLIPEAPSHSTPLQQSPLWHGRKWPVLFLPHTGLDEIERDGGGWYNASEARLACSVAQTLVYDSRVKQHDICIMSPFAAQVKLLRSLIRSDAYGGGSGLWDVNIGPLEAFQGLERRVVIICCTRTRERFLQEDEKRGLGIVGQKRKMNVALTRAKEALFVIGHPGVLGRDEHWRQWLAFCWRNGLVHDDEGIWEGDTEGFSGEKVGVLERALVAREEQKRGVRGRALGVAADGQEAKAEYEEWVESQREIPDDEDEDDDEDNEDEDNENEDNDNETYHPLNQTANTYTQQKPKNAHLNDIPLPTPHKPIATHDDQKITTPTPPKPTTTHHLPTRNPHPESIQHANQTHDTTRCVNGTNQKAEITTQSSPPPPKSKSRGRPKWQRVTLT